MFQVLSWLVVLQAETNGSPFDEHTLVLIALVSTAIFLILAIVLGYWTYRDASDRENNELAWALGTGGSFFLFFPLGLAILIASLVLRGEKSTPDHVP